MALRLIDAGDPVLAGEAVTAAVDELVGDGDRSLMLETLTEADYREDDGSYDATRLGVAMSTPTRLAFSRCAKKWPRPTVSCWELPSTTAVLAVSSRTRWTSWAFANSRAR